MKRLFLFTFACVFFSFIKAQNQPLFIFDQFINAKIHFRNHSVTVAPMNYDAANDKMYYKQGNDLMELTNAVLIDSISWAGKRCFVPYNQGYLEQVKLDNGLVFIQWRIKNVNVGSKGAMGAVTQAKVEQINIRALGVFSAADTRVNSADVYQKKTRNDYYLSIDGKLKKISNIKQLTKLYPNHKSTIEQYVETEKIKMEEPLLVLQLLNYCMGLE